MTPQTLHIITLVILFPVYAYLIYKAYRTWVYITALQKEGKLPLDQSDLAVSGKNTLIAMVITSILWIVLSSLSDWGLSYYRTYMIILWAVYNLLIVATFVHVNNFIRFIFVYFHNKRQND